MSFTKKIIYKQSGQTRSIKEMENKLTNTAIFDGKFYKIAQFLNGHTNVIARCQLCLPNITNLKGSCFTTSNFLTHLKRRHPGSIDQYYEHKRLKREATINYKREVERKQNLLPPPDLTITQNSPILEEDNIQVKEENFGMEDGHEDDGLQENCQKFIVQINPAPLEDQSPPIEVRKTILNQREEPDWRTNLTEILTATNIHVPVENHKSDLSEATEATTSNGINLEAVDWPKKLSLNTSQDEFNNKLFKFVIDTMLPLSVIEHDSFKDLFHGMNNEVEINKKVIAKKINEKFQSKKQKIKNNLSNTRYLCRALDTYSVDDYRFLVVTCYWIDENFKRQSALLGCTKINDKESHKILQYLDMINDQFCINDKIVATVTFNVWNYLKQIQDEFGIQLSECSNEADTIDADNEKNLLPEFNNHSTITFDHKQSASHIFNLIGTKEIVDIITKDPNLRINHKNVLKKCSILWRKSENQDSAEIIESILGYNLKCPKFNSWKSLYDCIKQVYDSKENICKVFEIIEETEFKESELLHIEEYLKFLKPLADTFEFLDSDENSYFGYLLPSILTLLVKYEKLKTNSDLQFFSLSVDKMIKIIETKFSHLFSINNESEAAIIAAVCIPSIKMRWLKVFAEKDSTADSDKICNIIINTACELPIPLPSSSNNKIEPCTKSEDADFEFFDFKEAELTINLSKKERIISELSKYLQDPRRDICLLEEYAIIKELFYKYNAFISSSAAVARLISFDNLVKCPNICAISNSLLEKYTILKADN